MRGYWLVDDEAVEGKDYTLDRLLPIWDLTNRQDWTICEDQQAGVSSRAYRARPLLAGSANATSRTSSTGILAELGA